MIESQRPSPPVPPPFEVGQRVEVTESGPNRGRRGSVVAHRGAIVEVRLGRSVSDFAPGDLQVAEGLPCLCGCIGRECEMGERGQWCKIEASGRCSACEELVKAARPLAEDLTDRGARDVAFIAGELWEASDLLCLEGPGDERLAMVAELVIAERDDRDGEAHVRFEVSDEEVQEMTRAVQAAAEEEEDPPTLRPEVAAPVERLHVAELAREPKVHGWGDCDACGETDRLLYLAPCGPGPQFAIACNGCFQREMQRRALRDGHCIAPMGRIAQAAAEGWHGLFEGRWGWQCVSPARRLLGELGAARGECRHAKKLVPYYRDNPAPDGWTCEGPRRERGGIRWRRAKLFTVTGPAGEVSPPPPVTLDRRGRPRGGKRPCQFCGAPGVALDLPRSLRPFACADCKDALLTATTLHLTKGLLFGGEIARALAVQRPPVPVVGGWPRPPKAIGRIVAFVLARGDAAFLDEEARREAEGAQAREAQPCQRHDAADARPTVDVEPGDVPPVRARVRLVGPRVRPYEGQMGVVVRWYGSEPRRCDVEIERAGRPELCALEVSDIEPIEQSGAAAQGPSSERVSTPERSSSPEPLSDRAAREVEPLSTLEASRTSENEGESPLSSKIGRGSGDPGLSQELGAGEGQWQEAESQQAAPVTCDGENQAEESLSSKGDCDPSAAGDGRVTDAPEPDDPRECEACGREIPDEEPATLITDSMTGPDKWRCHGCGLCGEPFELDALGILRCDKGRGHHGQHRARDEARGLVSWSRRCEAALRDGGACAKPIGHNGPHGPLAFLTKEAEREFYEQEPGQCGEAFFSTDPDRLRCCREYGHVGACKGRDGIEGRWVSWERRRDGMRRAPVVHLLAGYQPATDHEQATLCGEFTCPIDLASDGALDVGVWRTRTGAIPAVLYFGRGGCAECEARYREAMRRGDRDVAMLGRRHESDRRVPLGRHSPGAAPGEGDTAAAPSRKARRPMRREVARARYRIARHLFDGMLRQMEGDAARDGGAPPFGPGQIVRVRKGEHAGRRGPVLEFRARLLELDVGDRGARPDDRARRAEATSSNGPVGPIVGGRKVSETAVKQGEERGKRDPRVSNGVSSSTPTNDEGKSSFYGACDQRVTDVAKVALPGRWVWSEGGTGAPLTIGAAVDAVFALLEVPIRRVGMRQRSEALSIFLDALRAMAPCVPWLARLASLVRVGEVLQRVEGDALLHVSDHYLTMADRDGDAASGEECETAGYVLWLMSRAGKERMTLTRLWAHVCRIGILHGQRPADVAAALLRGLDAAAIEHELDLWQGAAEEEQLCRALAVMLGDVDVSTGERARVLIRRLCEGGAS